MVATPDPQVYDLGHLGLVASTVDRVGASTVHVGSLGRAGGASCWSSTQLHIMRPRCAPGGRAILPAGVKGVRNVGGKGTELD